MAGAALESEGIRIVYAERNRSLRREVASELAENGEFHLEPVPDVSGVRAELADGRLECVVTGSELEDGDWRDVVDAVGESDPDLPIVLYPTEPDPEVATEATALGVTEYLPVPYDDGDELPTRIRSVVADYRRDTEVRSESARYREIMETLPVSLYFKDAEARYVDASAKLADDVDEELVGRTDADVWDNPEDPTGVKAYQDDVAVVETGESIEGTEERHDAGDGDIWVRSHKYPWRDEDGEIRGLVGMTRNVSAQKEREKELREKSQRLEQFASFVSHDLRNPINIAQGYLDRARETGDEAAFRQVDDALDRMDALIEDLLTAVRRGDATREWVEFRPFVERAWTATETESVDLEVDVAEGTTIAAVPGQLRQLLDNLFRNADEHASSSPRSHTPEDARGTSADGSGPDESSLADTREDADEHASSSPRSHAREDAAGSSSGEPSLADAREDATGNVTVTVGTTDVGFYVEDDGRGIDPELREEVFEYGVTDGGTGIGLAIVSEIAATHGWEIEVTDSDEGGARFEFEGCPVRSEGFETVEPGEEIALDATTEIGDPTPPASVDRSADGETWTVDAGGEDLWQHVEEHFFAYGTVEGSARIVARVADVAPVDEFSKAGLMVRDWADADASLAYVGATPERGSETIHRPFPGDDIETEQHADVGGAPRWYRIDWIDNTVSLETSPHGSEWTTLDRKAIVGNDPVTIGLAVCSHDPERTCRAVFEHVRAVRLRPTDGED